MKNKMQLALGVLYVLLSISVKAQSVAVFSDTIIMAPNAGCKVMLTGSNLKSLEKYSRIDTVVNMLVADVEAARKNPSFPAASKSTHYFVTKEGKRRLKAEEADYLETGIDLKKERESINLDLPEYVYYIHDMAKDYECDIYLKNPDSLKQLTDVKFNEALTYLAAQKINNSYYRVNIILTDNKWVIPSLKEEAHGDFVELGTQLPVGLSVIGSQLSPTLGVALFLGMHNKYGVERYRAELEVSGYSFVEINNFELANIYPVVSYTARLLHNTSPGNQPSVGSEFLGIEGGLFQSNSREFLDNAKKFGIVFERHSFNISFDAIWNSKRLSSATYGLTVTLLL